MIYLLAFLGGLLLNLMPCVLPVLSLKLTGGNDRWYVAGILSVFMALATLNVALGFAWGGQFNSPWFVLSLAGITFVMGLNYLGVWHLPTFGFRVGKLGSFGKGVLATVLSTPCSGPFLGPIFAATLTETPAVVYGIFASIGLGMSSPIMAAPLARRLLPKPGAWMAHVKTVAGWMLIGTSIWLVYPSSQSEWEPYSDARFEQLRDQVVIVEFTARYCLTCQMNEAMLKSMDLDAVILRAEMPNGSNLLRSLGFNSVPVLAIFHPGREPVVLPDVITESQVLEALR